MTGRGMLKYDFTKKDRDQLQTYIKDLESTISINKEILKELIGGMSADIKHKRIIEKLNRENALLSKQVKQLAKERDDAQYRALINAQLTEDYKEKERDIYTECQEKNQELREQLNRKEYMLQHLEKKYAEAEKLLKKYSKHDVDIQKLLTASRAGKEPLYISNVVAENEKLKNDLSLIKYEKEKLQKEVEILQKLEVKRKNSDVVPKIVPKLNLNAIQKQIEDRCITPAKEIIKAEERNISHTPRPIMPKAFAKIEENQGACHKDSKEEHKVKEPKSFAELSSISNDADNSNNNEGEIEIDIGHNEIRE